MTFSGYFMSKSVFGQHFMNHSVSAVFCALHDQLTSLGRYAQLTRCFSVVAELLIIQVAILAGQWLNCVG